MVSATSLLAAAAEEPTFDSGDTAWILASAALVLLMTPGLAFFYGGMVRAKSALNMIMRSFLTIGIVSAVTGLGEETELSLNTTANKVAEATQMAIN